MYGVINYTGTDPTRLTLSRALAEVLGANDSYLPRVSRSAVEVLGTNDSYAPALTRAVLEVLGSNDSIKLAATRLVAEVLSDAPYAFTTPGPKVFRALAEVLGAASQFPGQNTFNTRTVVEVLSDALLQARQMSVPGTFGVPFTLVSVLQLSSPASAGSWKAADDVGDGLFLSWTGGNLTIRYVSGANVATTTVAAPSGKFLLTIRATAAGVLTIRVNSSLVQTSAATYVGPQSLTLGGGHTPGVVSSLLLYEFLLLPELNDARRDYAEQYLTCGSITTGCNPDAIPVP